MKKYIYTVIIGSIYWKSFNNLKEARKEASRLKQDGSKRIRINKEAN